MHARTANESAVSALVCLPGFQPVHFDQHPPRRIGRTGYLCNDAVLATGIFIVRQATREYFPFKSTYQDRKIPVPLPPRLERASLFVLPPLPVSPHPSAAFAISWPAPFSSSLLVHSSLSATLLGARGRTKYITKSSPLSSCPVGRERVSAVEKAVCRNI